MSDRFTPEVRSAAQRATIPPAARPAAQPDIAKPGTRKEIITLDEGDVIITFPENLSAESFADLEAYLALFVRKMKRRAIQERIEAELEAGERAYPRDHE